MKCLTLVEEVDGLLHMNVVRRSDGGVMALISFVPSPETVQAAINALLGVQKSLVQNEVGGAS